MNLLTACISAFFLLSFIIAMWCLTDESKICPECRKRINMGFNSIRDCEECAKL